VIGRVRAILPQAAVLVVDDGSTDETGAIAVHASGLVIRHARNAGKGAALATGIARALDEGAEAIVTLDADGQHPPDALPQLLAELAPGAVDLVLGARARSGGMPVPRRFTNWISATIAGRIAGTPVPDAQTGLRAFTRRLAVDVTPRIVRYTRYEYEAAFLLAALRAGYGVRSVAIPTIYDGQPSHFRSVADGWRVARVFARYLLGAS
jgi:glycosyltransferase involved in cell wall biosynthesis